jgi:hypothetical protein
MKILLSQRKRCSSCGEVLDLLVRGAPFDRGNMFLDKEIYSRRPAAAISEHVSDGGSSLEWSVGGGHVRSAAGDILYDMADFWLHVGPSHPRIMLCGMYLNKCEGS